ncbi:hypothetical protein ES703_111681 [subsurface metagenome]
MIVSSQTLSTEVRYLEADDPRGEFTVFLERKRGHEYDLDHYGEKFYIRTNDRAENFRLMETPITATGRENWKAVIPHREDVLLSSFELFREHLVLQERREGLIYLRIINWDGSGEHYIDFGEPAYLAYISTNPDANTQILRYGYTSMTTPNSIYDYDMVTREKVLLKQDEVLGDFDPNDYQTERLHATARDGVKVPVSIVYRKGIQNDGSSPLLLYGYGSYGSSTNATFSASLLSLLDRGFVYAIAHIRGGQEMGRQWYENGKLLKKKNTFTDFIDCAEYLIEEGYTNRDRLFARGGSAGGGSSWARCSICAPTCSRESLPGCPGWMWLPPCWTPTFPSPPASTMSGAIPIKRSITTTCSPTRPMIRYRPRIIRICWLLPVCMIHRSNTGNRRSGLPNSGPLRPTRTGSC